MNKNNFSVATRVDIFGTFIANNTLPNGDPNMANAPRVDSDGFGIISDVCQKFKIRARVATIADGKFGYEMFIKPTALDDRTLDAKVKEFTVDNEIDVARLKEHFFDIRSMGAVLISSKTGGEDESGADEETTDAKPKRAKGKGKGNKDKKNTDHVTGCVSVAFAKSTEPISIQDISLIRCAIQSEAEKEKGNRNTMGNKYIVTHAVYRFGISVNARRAAQNGFSDEDLSVLIEAVRTIFFDDESAARPAGGLDVGSMFVATHSSIDGDESTMKTFARMVVSGDDATVSEVNMPSGMKIARIV